MSVPPPKHPGSPTPVVVARAEEEAPVKRIGGKRSTRSAEFSDRGSFVLFAETTR
jgi:hypothetical protein